jgi:uncharacterized protein YdhG (YjbR/CyaY superfamily)
MPTSRKASSDAADVARKVRTYIAALAPKARAQVRKLRATIRAAAPAAVEGFSYGIPGFRLNGRPLVWYAGWAHHTSMYPMTTGVRKALGDKIEDYEMSKGTIRFPLDKPLPLPIVTRIVKARAAEVLGKAS